MSSEIPEVQIKDDNTALENNTENSLDLNIEVEEAQDQRRHSIEKQEMNIENKNIIQEKVETEDSPEEDLEESIEDIIMDREYHPYNFLINTSNQANLCNTNNTSHSQINALFVLISPYYIEEFHLKGLDLNIKMSEEGKFILDNQEFDAFEVKPGIKVFGISKQN